METSRTPVPFSPPRRLSTEPDEMEDLLSPSQLNSPTKLDEQLKNAPQHPDEAAYINSRSSHLNRVPESVISPRSQSIPRSRSLSVSTNTTAVENAALRKEIEQLKAKVGETDFLKNNVQDLLLALRTSDERNKDLIADLNATIEAERFKSKILEEELTQFENLYGVKAADLASPNIMSPQQNINIVPLSPSGQSQNLLQQVIEIEKENKQLKKRVAKQESVEAFLLDLEAKISSIEGQLKIRNINVEPKFYRTRKETIQSANERLAYIKISLEQLHSESEIQRLLNNTLFLETELSKHKTISNTERGTRKILDEAIKKVDKGGDFILSAANLAKTREECDAKIDSLKTVFRKQLEKLSSVMIDKLITLETELKGIQIDSRKRFDTTFDDEEIEKTPELLPAPTLDLNSPILSPPIGSHSPNLLESPPVLIASAQD